MFRSLVAKVLAAVLLLGLITAVAAKLTGFPLSRRPVARRPDAALLDKGKEAVARGDWAEAEAVAAALEEESPQAGHLLRGDMWWARARAAHRHAGAAVPYEEAQQAGQLVLAGAGLGGQPAVVRAAA